MKIDLDDTAWRRDTGTDLGLLAFLIAVMSVLVSLGGTGDELAPLVVVAILALGALIVNVSMRVFGGRTDG